MRKGFTLLETVFALTIIMIGFFGVFSLVEKSISATSTSIHRLIAANLAQEGIEIIRNIRDSAYLGGGDWSTVIDSGHLDKYSCLSSAKNCRVDIDNGGLLDEDANAYLKINANNEYQYDSGNDSDFKRWVNLTQGGGLCSQIATSTNCIQVKSTVTWKERNKDMSLSAEDYLYSWY